MSNSRGTKPWAKAIPRRMRPLSAHPMRRLLVVGWIPNTFVSQSLGVSTRESRPERRVIRLASVISRLPLGVSSIKPGTSTSLGSRSATTYRLRSRGRAALTHIRGSGNGHGVSNVVGFVWFNSAPSESSSIISASLVKDQRILTVTFGKGVSIVVTLLMKSKTTNLR
jgi:hypothetical protein